MTEAYTYREHVLVSSVFTYFIVMVPKRDSKEKK